MIKRQITTKLEMYRSTNVAIIPIILILCVFENPE